MTKTLFAGILAGLIGGIAGAFLLLHGDRVPPLLTPAIAAGAGRSEVVTASRIQLVDASGKVRAELAMSLDGGPALFFYDSAGRNRMVLGLYSPAEGEAPSVVLNDPQQRAAGIFRLFGPHDTPVVVLKNQGRDRSIYGLNASSAEPYLTNFSGEGKNTDVFGVR